MPATLLLLHPLPARGRSRLTQDLSHAEQHPLLHRDPGILAGAGHQAGLPGTEYQTQEPQRLGSARPRSLVVVIRQVVSERSGGWEV